MGSRAVKVGFGAALLALLALAAVLAWAPGAVGTPTPGVATGLQAELDAAVSELGVPGASAAVVDDGELVWSGVSGVRTIGGPPVEADTPFVTASSCKSVLAAMVFRLAEQGLLSLDDRVSEYLPDLRGARRIRIAELLNHSSGLPDYLNSARLNELFYEDPKREWNRDEVLDLIPRPRFRPGSRNRYSNTNYIALGGVIEEVTGSRIEDVFRREIADPLGLTGSSWLYDPSLYDRAAHPYYERRGRPPADAWRTGFVPSDYVGEVWTDGGLATTGADLATFANALVAGDLLQPVTRDAMTTFRGQGFGLGIFRYWFDGSWIVGHDGLYGGFSSQHWTDPESGVTVAVLANLETRGGHPDSSWAIWKRLAKNWVSQTS